MPEFLTDALPAPSAKQLVQRPTSRYPWSARGACTKNGTVRAPFSERQQRAAGIDALLATQKMVHQNRAGPSAADWKGSQGCAPLAGASAPWLAATGDTRLVRAQTETVSVVQARKKRQEHQVVDMRYRMRRAEATGAAIIGWQRGLRAGVLWVPSNVEAPHHRQSDAPLDSNGPARGIAQLRKRKTCNCGPARRSSHRPRDSSGERSGAWREAGLESPRGDRNRPPERRSRVPLAPVRTRARYHQPNVRDVPQGDPCGCGWGRESWPAS